MCAVILTKSTGRLGIIQMTSLVQRQRNNEFIIIDLAVVGEILAAFKCILFVSWTLTLPVFMSSLLQFYCLMFLDMIESGERNSVTCLESREGNCFIIKIKGGKTTMS